MRPQVGGLATAPDGPFARGLCFKKEVSPHSNYCDSSSTQWPWSPGKSYEGRGPIQLPWNYNFGPAGKPLGFDGLNKSLIAFKTALWFWMTEHSPKPSCRSVLIGKHKPPAADQTAGYGLVTNTINGGLECGMHELMIGSDFFSEICNVV